MKRIVIVAIVCLLSGAWTGCLAQQNLNVLFIGNSYTAVNNLPQTIKNIASSMGDNMTYQSNTPGGCTLSQHCSNHSMELICEGGWDIVVLQEQSQYPSFPQSQVEAEVFPYAKRLVDSVYSNNYCAEPMFYMTWGRKNGDADNAVYFPVLGTYEGMDSMLCERYTYMAQVNDASLCPVGRVWRYLRCHNPDIELYQSDGSHPSQAGTYAAACSFYVMFFHRDPELITYNGSLSSMDAQAIRAAVREVVFGELSNWQRPYPVASFAVEMIDSNNVAFVSSSLFSDSLEWHYGDGVVEKVAATTSSINHFYADAGDYDAVLVASRHCMTDTFSVSVSITYDTVPPATGFANVNDLTSVTLFPNPVSDRLNVTVSNSAGTVVASVYGLDGKRLIQTSSQCPDFHIDVSGLSSGEYILFLSAPSGVAVRRFIVRR
ncbi:MAG: T9SS type A sorting domain-containing protein [Bacteroidales bacterium]|nr:T9SS type A sorting domain-containing protein [Bacteroidales bacterium]